MKLVGHKYLVCHSFCLASYILFGYCFGTRMSPVDAERTRPQRINLKKKPYSVWKYSYTKQQWRGGIKEKNLSVFAFVFSFCHSLGILLSKVPSDARTLIWATMAYVYDLRANTVSVRNARSGGGGAYCR